MNHLLIRNVTTDDAAAICNIYNHYIRETVITFEEIELTTEEMADRMARITATYPYFVAEIGGKVVGYAYLDAFRTRYAYRFSAEISIYLHPDHCGKGVGRELMKKLIAIARDCGLHNLVGGVTLPNPASVRLHESFGFRKVGQFNQIGYKFGQWLDVGFWELLLLSGKSRNTIRYNFDQQPITY